MILKIIYIALYIVGAITYFTSIKSIFDMMRDFAPSIHAIIEKHKLLFNVIMATMSIVWFPVVGLIEIHGFIKSKI